MNTDTIIFLATVYLGLAFMFYLSGIAAASHYKDKFHPVEYMFLALVWPVSFILGIMLISAHAVAREHEE